ncbi:MAG: PTS sugar transporter subunit IIA [Candidatus Hydrogenedentes bacterium]|nr:PTS sugar transporter subunit IIA [Candidatus Hydrogenedentota bacterium]
MAQLDIVIPKEQIVILPPGLDKSAALDRLVDAMAGNPVITDGAAFRRAVFEREAVMSTGIGNGVAVPHVRIAEVTVPTLGLAVSAEGVDFQALDNRPAHILVLFATPVGSEKTYLAMLAKVMLVLRNRNLYASLLSCHTPEEVHAVLNR